MCNFYSEYDKKSREAKEQQREAKPSAPNAGAAVRAAEAKADGVPAENRQAQNNQPTSSPSLHV